MRKKLLIESGVISDLPKDCEDAFRRGMTTGETHIWPNTDDAPFLVYCDMERINTHGE